MSSDSRAGRPRVSSRETLAEAACELFLEQGYAGTSVADIAQRAGVSRASFFNYFASKSDLLWSGLDARIDDAVDALEAITGPGDRSEVRGVLRDVVEDFAPDSLALALGNAHTMGLDDELERETALRQARLATAVADVGRRAGRSPIRAEIEGAATAAAVMAAVREWALLGPGRRSLRSTLDGALETLGEFGVRD